MMKSFLPAFAIVASAFAAEPATPKTLEIGAQAPDFALPGLDGKIVKLSDFASSKVLCVIFTCNHCPEAVAAGPRTERIYQDYKDKGVAVVAVNSNNPIGLRPDELGYSPYNDSAEEMKPFAAENGWTFPYLYDGETQAFAQACGAQATPHVFIFDADRKLRYTGRMDDAGRKHGPIEKSYVRDALDAVLAGREVATPTTRAVGCSTKWIWKKDSVAAEQKAWEAKDITVGELDLETAKKLRANASGNVRLINFWSTTCGPCVAEFPALVETYRRFQNRSFDFVTISLDPKDDLPKVRKFLEKQTAALSDRTKPSLEKEGRTTNNYVWAGDNADHLAEAIDSEWSGAQPHSVILNEKGEVVWRHTGEVDVTELRRAIVKALENMP